MEGDVAMGTVYLKTHKEKGRAPDIQRWQKRFLSVDQDMGQLQLYKNDQALNPKETISFAEISAPPTPNKTHLLTIHTKSGKQYTLRTQTPEERDSWVRTIERLIAELAWQVDGEHMERFLHSLDTWRRVLADAYGNQNMKLIFEHTFYNDMSPQDRKDCLATLSTGSWVHVIETALKELRSGRHVPQKLEVITVRRYKGGAAAAYEKATATLTFQIEWLPGGDGHSGSVRHPDAAYLVTVLATTVWQKEVDKVLEKTRRWQEGLSRIHATVGKEIPVAVDWDSAVEDTPAMRAYVDKYMALDILREIGFGLSKAVEKADSVSPKGKARDILRLWVAAITILVEAKNISDGKPPCVKLHRRVAVRHNDSEEGGLPRVLVNQFCKCKGVDPAVDHLFCSGVVGEPFGKQVADALFHVRTAEICRQAERITVGSGKKVLNFKMDWDTFLGTTRSLSVTPAIRLRLAEQFLMQYPRRVDGVASSMQIDEWGTLCDAVTKVVVKFEGTTHDEQPETRTGIYSTELRDIVYINRKSDDGSSSVVMVFDVKDLGSYCRGLVAGSSLVLHPEVAAEPRPTRRLTGKVTHSRTHSHEIGPSSESENHDHPSSETSSNEEMFTTPRLRHSTRSIRGSARMGPLEAVPPITPLAVNQETHFEDFVGTDRDLPSQIEKQIEAARGSSPAFFNRATIEATIKALDEVFYPDVIGQEDKLRIIPQAVAKLQKIFSLYDKEKTGSIPREVVRSVITRFEEYHGAKPNESRGDVAGALQVKICNMSGNGDTVRLDVIALVLMTELFPIDVKTSLYCKRHCLILGLQSSGKTLVVHSLKQRKVEATEPTIGVRPEVVSFAGLNLSLLEVGGSEEQRKCWKKFSKHQDVIHGVVYVIDGAKTSTFPANKAFLQEILSSRHLRRAPLLLLVNNSGSKECASDEDILAALKVEKYCRETKREFKLFRVHLTGPMKTEKVDPNLAQAFTWLAQHLRDRGGQTAPTDCVP